MGRGGTGLPARRQRAALTLATPDRLAAFEASGTGHLIALTPRLLDGVPEECEPEVTRADDPAVIYYTSGTSGPPKGVVHAHRWLLGHNEFTVCHQLTQGELFHGAGDWAWSLAKLLGPWRHGAVPFVFHQPGRFDPVALFEAMAAEGVGNMLLNPTMLRRLRAVLPEAGKQIPLRPRRAYSSSEPLPADLARWFTEQFHVPLYDYYGLTESYPMIGVLPGTTAPSGSMGRALPGWQVAVLDDRDRPVPPGTPARYAFEHGPTRNTRWATGTVRRTPVPSSRASGSAPVIPPPRTTGATSTSSAAATT